jgi:hypothetical protein
MERRLHLRHPGRRRDRHPAAAVRQLAAAGVPPLRRAAHQELENVYDFLDAGGTGLWSRWRTARAASKLHTVLLDVNELTERADNAIKFLSDMFSARLYKLCAAKVGVPDYKDLVKEKLQTAEDLYRFMVDQFNQSRAFVLELMVVVILIIELVYFFRGKPMGWRGFYVVVICAPGALCLAALLGGLVRPQKVWPHFWGHVSKRRMVGDFRKGYASCRPASWNGTSGNVSKRRE